MDTYSLNYGPAEDDTMSTPEPKHTELLPFTIRTVNSDRDIERAASLRKSAYGRHLPQFAEKLGRPEAADYQDDTVVLLAESKLDKAPLATMRVHINHNAPLPLEQAVVLPPHLRGASLAEAVRLAIIPGREGHVPRDAIFKAFYLTCKALNVDWMVICARHPLYKLYQAMYFEDAILNGTMVPLPYAADIPHRVLNFNVNNAEHLWRTRKHPLYDFMVRTHHSDIEDFRLTCRTLTEKVQAKKITKTRTSALH